MKNNQQETYDAWFEKQEAKYGIYIATQAVSSATK